MYLLTSKKVEGSMSKHCICSKDDDQRCSIVFNVQNIYLFAKVYEGLPLQSFVESNFPFMIIRS